MRVTQQRIWPGNALELNIKAMFLLAIETSSRIGSVALYADGRIVCERSFEHGLQNAAHLLPLIDDACREVSATGRDITHVAVSIGPGSFTGLRIGVTLAKTLCFATGAKLIAVPTLPVIASNAPQAARYVMPILDAKRDQVYAAMYELRHGGTEARRQEAQERHALDEIIPPQLVHLPELLHKVPRPLLILGEGVKYHRQHIPADVEVAPDSLWLPRAATVVHIALQLHQQGAYADPFKLTPMYIRKPEAQERMEAGLLKHLEA